MDKDELIRAGFDAAVAAIGSWSENTSATLRAAATGLERNRESIISRLQPSGDGEKACRNCSGCGWVCEDHRDTPWAGLVAGPKCCGGAGAPCPVCNPEMACAGYIESARTDGYAKALEGALEEWVFLFRWKVDGMNIEQARIHARAFVTEGRANFIRALAGKDAEV